MFYIINIKILNFTDFMKNLNLKTDTRNESQSQTVFNNPTYPRDSELYSDKGFVFKDNGSQCGTHRTCCIVKDKKSYHFDSFGANPDKFLLKQLPKPIINPNYKIQEFISLICGSYRLHIFYLIEKMNYFDAILKCNLVK